MIGRPLETEVATPYYFSIPILRACSISSTATESDRHSDTALESRRGPLGCVVRRSNRR
jgi:hypothetical protein